MRIPLFSLLAAAATAVASVAASVPTTSVTLQLAVAEHLHPAGQPDPVALQAVFLSKLPSWTHATLSRSGAVYESAPLTPSGRLVLANVTAGSYLGEVHCATHLFLPIRVDVTVGDDGTLTATATETYRGNDWANRGEALRRLDVADGSTGASGASGATSASGPTFMVSPATLAPKSYYTERSTFNVLALLKNPMILMALVAMVVMFGMPYLMENMDPEMKAEFEARQKENSLGSMLGGGAAPPGAGFDMAAYLAGSDKKKTQK